jgi:hypothetical protein
MTERPTYGVTVTREDQLWTATIDGLPPHVVGVTDVEHFADLEVEVRDLVAGLTDTDPDAFELSWHYVQDGREYTPSLQDLHTWADQARVANQRHDAARFAAIEAMKAAGLPLRAIADVVGLSHQRVDQLLKERRAG